MLSDLRAELRVKPEFKFSKLYAPHRLRFFDACRPLRFRTRSVVVRKDLIYSESLRTVTDSFYKFFIRIMMEHDGGCLRNAKVVIDGSGDRKFKRSLRSYLRRQLEPGAVSKLDLKDSVKDPLVQLADMCAGAIARSYRPEKPDSRTCRTARERQGKIENVWDFR